MIKIRNKKTGEIREISENDLNKYGLGGKINKLGVKNSLWNNIRANRGSGRKPTKQMLEQEAKIKAAEKAYGGYYADGGKMPTEVLRSRLESHMSPQEADNYLEQYADGGSFNNPGFRALPGYVQDKIKSNMALGGFMGDYIDEDDTMEYGEGGYTVRRSNDRKGKTHVVTGPDGTKKYFGDPNLGERGKSKYGKDAFYARHKKNLAKNPYFRAYARATWEDGGYMNMLDSNVDMVDMETPMYEYGGSMMYGQGGGIHIDPSKRGTFKAQASRMGMGVQQAASSILNAPEGKYSPAMRKKANFARNFAKANGGYMYQMGGEMMAQQPQGGGQEEIMQQVAQMLQQGMAPEQIVGQLVQMGVPQEQAIQIVQMIVQQMQGQQQAPQEAPQQAPPMMRRGGYMYQMGGEMAPQQAPQQGGDQEQIMQAIVQMLQQGLQPEQIVGELVKMGIPQESAIQAVQMVMEQAQQSQGMQQQQQQAAPPVEQGMMGQQQGAPATMRGGGRMYQMGGSLADNYLAQVNQYPVLKRGGGKLYYQDAGLLPDEGLIPTFETQNSTKEPVPPYVKPTGVYPYTPPSNLPNNPLTQTALRNFYKPKMSTVEAQQQPILPILPSLPSLMNNEVELTGLKEPQISPELVYKTFPVGKPKPKSAPPLGQYKSPMGNYIAGGVGSMLGPLANAAAAAFAPDPTYTAAPKLGRYDYTPVALQRAQANQAMANTRQAIRMGAPTQGSYLANVGVALPSAGASYGSQIAQTRYGIDAQNMGLANQEATLRAAQAEKNALLKDQSISNRWKLGMEAAAGTGRNIQGFSKDLAAKEMQDMMINQLRTGDFSVIGYENVNGTLVPRLAPTGLANYNDGTYTLSDGKRVKYNPETKNFDPI